MTDQFVTAIFAFSLFLALQWLKANQRICQMRRVICTFWPVIPESNLPGSVWF